MTYFRTLALFTSIFIATGQFSAAETIGNHREIRWLLQSKLNISAIDLSRHLMISGLDADDSWGEVSDHPGTRGGDPNIRRPFVRVFPKGNPLHIIDLYARWSHGPINHKTGTPKTIYILTLRFEPNGCPDFHAIAMSMGITPKVELDPSTDAGPMFTSYHFDLGPAGGPQVAVNYFIQPSCQLTLRRPAG
jgi:hypothetical protein